MSSCAGAQAGRNGHVAPLLVLRPAGASSSCRAVLSSGRPSCGPRGLATERPFRTVRRACALVALRAANPHLPRATGPSGTVTGPISTDMAKSRTSPVALLLLAALSWGLSAALTKVALEQVSPLDLFAVEVAMGALVLCAAALARGARPSRPSIPVLALGVLDPGLAILLFDVGLAHTAATLWRGAAGLDYSLFTVGARHRPAARAAEPAPRPRPGRRVRRLGPRVAPGRRQHHRRAAICW